MKAIDFIHGEPNSPYSHDCFEVLEADEVIKRVFPEAHYYVNIDYYGIYVFLPIEKKELKKYYRYYKINGQFYETCASNKYKELKDFYEKEKFKQLSLF